MGLGSTADRSARIAKWFVNLGRQQSLLKTITPLLRADHAISVQRLTARFIKNGNLANKRGDRPRLQLLQIQTL
jgi:hypothetical protein